MVFRVRYGACYPCLPFYFVMQHLMSVSDEVKKNGCFLCLVTDSVLWLFLTVPWVGNAVCDYGIS